LGHIYTKIDLSSCKLVEDCYGVSDRLLLWLKNSCIKTKSGEDLVCYHGSPSTEQFAVFNDSTAYGCNSFIGFFSLNRDFAECYTNDGSDLGSGNVRGFAIRSKKLFDSKNPACMRFLKANLPDNILCRGDLLDKDSFLNYVKTEKIIINNYKLDTSKFNTLKVFEQVGLDILGESGWEYSCSLDSDKQLQNKYFLGTNPESNSVFVLGHYNLIKPKKLPYKYWNDSVEGIRLSLLQITFDTALNVGILTDAHLNALAHGQPVHIKLSAEEFVNFCSYDKYNTFTEEKRQKLRDIIQNSAYDDVDLSIDVILMPQNISLNEFSQGMSTGQTIDNTNMTWRIYEDSYCLIGDQKIHIIDWLKDAGFDAVVIKENWSVNIICLYKNMIKEISNKMPTESDNVYEKYNYSDALLADLL
jgi:hypothetical protein